MYAVPGNWFIVRGRTLDQPVRVGQVVEVSHSDGSPPYVVRWSGDQHTSVVFPGPDAVVSTELPYDVAGGGTV